MILNLKTKYVVTSSAVPDECISHAQVLIVGESSWHVIAPAPYRLHCLLSFERVPKVSCPVVNVIKMEELLIRLSRLGATIALAGVSSLKRKYQ